MSRGLSMSYGNGSGMTERDQGDEDFGFDNGSFALRSRGMQTPAGMLGERYSVVQRTLLDVMIRCANCWFV